MKKYLFIAVLLVVTGLFLVSCNRSPAETEAEMAESYQQGFVELNNRIAEFEKEAGYGNVDTRASFWSKLGWIVGADALGAIIGSLGGPGMAIIVSAGSSISAAFSLMVVGSDDSVWNNTKSTGEFDEIITALGNAGLEHNQILQSFFEKDYPGFDVMTPEEQRAFIIQEIHDIIQTTYQTELPSLDECLSFPSQQTMLPSGSIDELASRCIESNPELTNEITVIKHCAQTYSSLDVITDLKTYSKGISTIIEEAAIPAKSKAQIKSGASVAAFSKLYWEESLK